MRQRSCLNQGLQGRTISLPSPSHHQRLISMQTYMQHQPRTVLCSSTSTKSPNCVIEVEEPDGSGRGSYEAESGEILRISLLGAKHELYQGWAKITNCNGGGTCGTCLIEITEDESCLASERTATEVKKLKGKKDTFRLACQTVVGDGENSGMVKVKLGAK